MARYEQDRDDDQGDGHDVEGVNGGLRGRDPVGVGDRDEREVIRKVASKPRLEVRDRGLAIGRVDDIGQDDRGRQDPLLLQRPKALDGDRQQVDRGRGAVDGDEVRVVAQQRHDPGMGEPDGVLERGLRSLAREDGRELLVEEAFDGAGQGRREERLTARQHAARSGPGHRPR